MQTALRLLALDPLQEPVHRAVMRLYVSLAGGRPPFGSIRSVSAFFSESSASSRRPRPEQLYQEILRQRPLRGAT